MAVKATRRGRGWSRFHFLMRFLGLAGLLIGGVAAFLAAGYLNAWLSSLDEWPSADKWQQLQSTLAETPMLQYLAWAVLGGFAAVLLAMLVEILVVIKLVAGRRSAFGANVALQVCLAAALVIGINVFSFGHYLRFDWTHAKQFTLPDPIPEQLTQLEGETTIVVYQPHITFGKFSDKPDPYDKAAGRKVIEKVHDLVEQFRQLGPQFRVEVLDIDDEKYANKLAALTKKYPDLQSAIDKAKENSIFFIADGRVQRLSFNDFYYLDKVESKQDDDGRGNLVLLSQGAGPVARRVLNLNEKRPRVGILAIHELFNNEGFFKEDGLAGLQKALTDNDFDPRTIILKAGMRLPLKATAASIDQSKFERLKAVVSALKPFIEDRKARLKLREEQLKEWQTAALADLTKKYAAQLMVDRVTQADREINVFGLSAAVTDLREQVDKLGKQLANAETELAGLQDVESLADQRREDADLKAKTARMLEDCDLLIVPRQTMVNLALGEVMSPRLFALDPGQVAAIKDFFKAGKPVLAFLGPNAENPADGRHNAFNPEPMPDGFEKLLAELGVQLNNQAILFDVERPALAETGAGLFALEAGIPDVPSVRFSWERGAGESSGRPAHAGQDLPAHPIRQSMQLISRGLGQDGTLDLRVRHPRPIYFQPAKDLTLKHDPWLLLTDRASSNEDRPFDTINPDEMQRPMPPEAPKAPIDERRNGPFPIGLALETELPAGWYESGTQPATVRLVVLGHGTMFAGPSLSPTQERFLVNSCNWLLGRDDRLPKAETPWRYPRIHLTPAALFLWQWGAWLGPPLLFAFIGLVVVLVRRLR